MEGKWVWEIEPVQSKDVEFLKRQSFAFSVHECALAYVLFQNFLKKLGNQTSTRDSQMCKFLPMLQLNLANLGCYTLSTNFEASFTQAHNHFSWFINLIDPFLII